MSGLSPFIRNLTCPVLAANIILDKEPELKNEENLHKSIILDINDVKVGIIGYLTPDTQFLADRTNVEYVDEIIALKEEVQILQSRGVNILIALGHSGYLKDKEIAKEVDGIDLVIGGHSNTFLWNGTSPDVESINGPYPTMIQQKTGRMVPVVQAYAYTKYLGKLELTFDSYGEILNYSGSPILLDHTIPQDQSLLKIINHYSAEVTRITDEVVGSSIVILDGTHCRIRECNIGNLITDAMVEYYVKYYKENNCTNAPIAIIQSGRIRTSIAHSGLPIPLTRGDWISVLPFSGNLVVLTINGSVLLEALEHTVKSWRILDAPGQFLQVSGMEILYDLAKPPGSRVAKALARCSTCNKLEIIKKNGEYRVMMPAFIYEGGDGFTMLDNKYFPVEKLPYAELTCITKYLHDHSPVSPEVTGRMKIINENEIKHINGATSLRISLIGILSICYTVLF